MALNAPYTPNTVIQSTQVSNDLTGLANGTNDTTNNSMATYRSEANFDYVASACVWSGDAYASTRNASQTSGVVYIAGVRLAVAAVSAHLFTASKDTYIDINGSGVQVYTEVTNNAASPALTAGSLRLGIIITGATTIAAATSINQGQETMVLPIASSIAYSVTDSLGNLICPRDINRKLLGYRQRLTDFASGTTAETLITGLNTPIIVPTGRKIKVTLYSYSLTATTTPVPRIYNGVFGSGGTEVQQANDPAAGTANLSVMFTPSTASITISATIGTVAGNPTFGAASTSPSFMLVELG